MRTAFIVLTYNRSDALLAVLRSLAPQCGEGDEILIADDGSRGEEVRALRAGLPPLHCRVRHIWHPDAGFTIARARNLCAARAESDYLVFLDGDSVPNARFAEQHRQLAEAAHFVIGTRVLLGEHLTRLVLSQEVDLMRLTPAAWLRLGLSGEINKLTHLAHGAGAHARRVRAFRWKGIRGCNMAFWKVDYESVNGFDESFSGWGHEDADMVLRLHHAGRCRKNALLGTEVFHLWHPQNSRASATANRERVLARTRTAIVRAQAGLAESWSAREVLVTELNG